MAQHNHSVCIEKCTQSAQDIATLKGKKLTTGRLQVLQILLHDHKALGAYDILEKMRQSVSVGASMPQPPTVYRALDFLLELGLIHKVESQNSYYACTIDKTDDEHHMAQAFICELCGHVDEKVAQQGAKNLFEKAQDFGFKINKVIMECRGICQQCQKLEART